MAEVNGFWGMPCVNMGNIAVCILVGGASSRMGHDKAALVMPNGQTLLEYAVAKYQLNNLLVFSSGGVQSNLCPQVADLFSRRLGPVAGIISSIMWLGNTNPEIKRCVFIPVDLVYLEWQDLSNLIQSISDVAYFTDNPLPLVVHISASTLQICKQVFNEMLTLTGYPVHKFIQKFKVQHKESNFNPHCLTNLNYFADWEKFTREYLGGFI